MESHSAREGNGYPTPGPSGVSFGKRSATAIERRQSLSENAFLNILFKGDCAVDSDSEGGESEGEAFDVNKQPQVEILDDPDNPDIVDLEGDVIISVPERPESSYEHDESESESELGHLSSESSFDISVRHKRTIR